MSAEWTTAAAHRPGPGAADTGWPDLAVRPHADLHLVAVGGQWEGSGRSRKRR